MASPGTDIATGITITFGTSGFTGNITDISGPSMTREAIDSSHQGTENSMTFIFADLVDRGEVSFTMHYNPDTDPPIDAEAETITIAYPTAGASIAFTGGMIAHSNELPLNGLMTADVTIKVSGDITRVPA